MSVRFAFASNAARRVAVTGLALVSLAAGAVELLGFRGVAWGTDAASLGPAALVSDGSGVRCYKRERENLLYGDLPLAGVRYCFHRDRLFSVVVESTVPLKLLQAEFQSTYGPPAAQAPTRATWGGRATRARIEIVSTAPGAPASMHIHSTEFEPRENHAGKSGD